MADFSELATVGDYDFVGFSDNLVAASQWKAHLLEEGGIARITLQPLEVGLAF